MITIGWQFNDEEHAYGWCDRNGNSFPLLPINSVVIIESHRKRWKLVITKYTSYFTPESGILSIYAECDVIEVENV